MSSRFYRAFEDRHRGSRELILSRLEVYLPFIEQLKELHSPCVALDLGCGRGEWLQLLESHGVQAGGVDLDDGMLEACRDLGLQVEQRDAIETLQGLPDNSLSLVSGFHLVEHIAFSQVQQIAEQALRVLQPGGLLILETPNAENLIVGSHSFYLDPTHVRPVPHLLLAFVTELAGFARNKVLRLQENSELHHLAQPRLQDVLGGVSPDYAVVAQKSAEPDVSARFDAIFKAEYGISLDHITQQYDQALNHRLTEITCLIEELTQREQELRSALADTHERLASDEHETGSLRSELQKVELRSAQLEIQAEQMRQQALQAMQRAHQEEIRAREAEINLREAMARTAHLDARYDTSQSNIQRLNQQVEDLTKEQLALVRRSNELEFELEHNKEFLSELRQRCRQQDLQLGKSAAEIYNLTAANQASREELERLRGQLQRHTEAAVAAAASAATIDIFKQQLAGARAELKMLRRQAEIGAQRLQSTTHNLNESLGNAHNWYLRATASERHVKELLRSTSWRITAPIRGVRRFIGWLLILPLRAVKALLRPLFARLMHVTLQHPAFRQIWSSRLRGYPRLYSHLRLFATSQGVLIASPPIPSIQQQMPALAQEQEAEANSKDLAALTPRAQQIYQDLKVVMEKNKEPQ